MSWSFTENKYNSIINRLLQLEKSFNDLAVAQDNLATLAQLQELLVIVQSRIKDLEDQVTALESRVSSIENEPLN